MKSGDRRMHRVRRRRPLLPGLLVRAFTFTDYVEREALRKRPYLRKEWCVRVVENPLHTEPQEGNRWRFWGEIPELDGRYLRVVTREDKVTIHNAFPERRFQP